MEVTAPGSRESEPRRIVQEDASTPPAPSEQRGPERSSGPLTFYRTGTPVAAEATLVMWSVLWLAFSALANGKIGIELLQAGGADPVRECRVRVVRGEHGVPRPPAVSRLEARAGATQHEEIEQRELKGQPSDGTRYRRPQRQRFLPRSLETGHGGIRPPGQISALRFASAMCTSLFQGRFPKERRHPNDGPHRRQWYSTMRSVTIIARPGLGRGWV